MKYIFSLLFASFQLFCVTNVLAQIPENLPAADTEKVSALLQNFGDNIASGNAKEILQRFILSKFLLLSEIVLKKRQTTLLSSIVMRQMPIRPMFIKTKP